MIGRFTLRDQFAVLRNWNWLTPMARLRPVCVCRLSGLQGEGLPAMMTAAMVVFCAAVPPEHAARNSILLRAARRGPHAVT